MIQLLEVAMSCLTLIVLAGCAVGNAVHKREIVDPLLDELRAKAKEAWATSGVVMTKGDAEQSVRWSERAIAYDKKVEAHLREREKAKAGE